MREPSSTYIFATRPGTLTANSERTGEMNSPVATMVPPDSVATPLTCGSPVVVAPVAVAAAATFCTSLGSAGAACVVVARRGLRLFEKKPRLLLALFRGGDARRNLSRLPDRNTEPERAVSIAAGRKRGLLIDVAGVERDHRQVRTALLLHFQLGDADVVLCDGNIRPHRLRFRNERLLVRQRSERRIGRGHGDVAAQIEIGAQRALRRLALLLRGREQSLRGLDRGLGAEHIDLRHFAGLIERGRLR